MSRGNLTGDPLKAEQLPLVQQELSKAAAVHSDGGAFPLFSYRLSYPLFTLLLA